MPAIAIYTRISKDADGTQTATSRQEQDCRALASIRDWEIADVYSDVDLSAYRRGVPRPGFERLLDDVENHRVDGVLVWKLDRLVRRSAEFERFWGLAEDADVFLASATEPIDTTTELGMVIVRILVAFAQMESATMSLRIRRSKEERAQAGRPMTGHRGFGHTDTRLELVPEEAAMIRGAAARILAGDSMRSIVLEWNAAGIPAPAGGLWKVPTLRHMLLQPRMVGDQTFRGELVERGRWAPILDRDTWLQLAALLHDPDRKVTRRGVPALLSGLIRCGRCGTLMRAGIDMYGKRRYTCPSRPEGCNRVSSLAEPLEDAVTAQVLAVLDREGVTAPVLAAADEGTEAELGKVTDALAELSRDYYLERRISRAAFEAANGELERRRVTLERQAARRRRGRAVGDLAAEPGGPVEAWERAQVERRREVVRDLVEDVTLQPVGRGQRRRFGPDEMQVTWR